MEQCWECGKRIDYETEPFEHYEMCCHFIAVLRSQVPEAEPASSWRRFVGTDLFGVPVLQK